MKAISARLVISLVSVLSVVACESSMHGDDAPDSPRDADNPDSRHDAGGGKGSSDVTQSGTRVKTRVLKTPDGAKAFAGWVDTQRNEDCDFHIAADGVMRCLPSSTSQVAADYGYYFADASCTIPVAFYYASCSPPSYVSVTGTPTSCPSSSNATRIFTRGASYTSYYQKT